MPNPLDQFSLRLRFVLQNECEACCLDDPDDLARVVATCLHVAEHCFTAPLQTATTEAAVKLGDALEDLPQYARHKMPEPVQALVRDYIRAKYLERTATINATAQELVDDGHEEA